MIIKDINDVFIKKKEYYLLKNFLSNSQLKTLLDTAFSIDDSSKQPTPRGFIAPCSFAQFESAGADAFSSTTYSFKANHSAALKALHTYLFDFFCVAKGSFALAPLTLNIADKRVECPLFSFRVIHADEAGMHIHCHNQLHELNPSFARNTLTELDVTNDVSYFIMLQKPQAGGELVLYDAPWQAGQRSSGNEYIVQPSGELLDVNNPDVVKKQTVAMQPGDMVVFESGQTWHQITAVQGALSRITLGGFFSKNKKADTVYYYT